MNDWDNPSPMPRGSLKIPMPDVPPPKAWSMPETRLAKALRLSPEPVVQPHWKAIKHAGLRVEKEYDAPPPPPPQDFIYLHGEPAARPWWWFGYAVIGILAMVIVIALAAHRIGPFLY